MDSLTFIIPAYNDGATIQMVVTKAVAVGGKLHIPFDMLGINDASSDSTGVILKKLSKQCANLHIITHTNNAGYGATIKELYQKAGSDWLFSVPGDYQIDPGQLTKLWSRRTSADMIIGWRKKRTDSPARLWQSHIYNWLLHALFRLTIHDVNSVRLMKTSVIRSVQLSSTSAFVDAELAIRAQRAGFRITEVPISHRARAGVGAGGGKLKTILPTIRDMIGFWL